MKIIAAQINSTLGDFRKNADQILHILKQAEESSADLVLFPEMTLFGYSPVDLLEFPQLVEEQLQELKRIKKQMPKGMTVLIGAVTCAPKGSPKPFYNSVVALSKIEKFFHKQFLPTYDIFDETRFFTPGKIKDNILTICGRRFLIMICEDMWFWERATYGNPLVDIKGKKIDGVLSINASPFAYGKIKRRQDIAKKTAHYLKCPVIYVNRIGAQDEHIYDGASFAVDKTGKIFAQSQYWKEELSLIDFDSLKSTQVRLPTEEGAILRGSLVSGIKDFVNKNGLKRVHLGLSGGIDSAVVAALAVEALGPENVTTIYLPGPYSTAASEKLAHLLAKNLGCQYHQLGIGSTYEQSLKEYSTVFGDLKFGLVQENLQARLRGLFLMMYSNQTGSLLLSTGNKSEMATGYSTLYGDMCGGLAPIADLLKRQVYLVAQAYNSKESIIPQEIIDRAPSAELRPNQKDQDSLPPYEELDQSVERIVSLNKPAKTSTDRWLLKMLANSEFKRWQAPPILRVSNHAFGRGRRMPISSVAFKG